MKKEIHFYKKGYRVLSDGCVINKSGDLIKGHVGSSGYKTISTRNKSNTLQCLVHRLQAFQKYGMKLYETNIEVRHNDGSKLNNSYSNILIGTHKQNMLDVPKHIRVSRAVYASSFIKKYNKKEVQDYHIKNGRSYNKTMNHYGISSKGTLHYVLNN